VAALCVCRIVEYDKPWYVACGRLIARTGSLPALDPFSFTSTKPWLNHEWLSELVLAGVHAIGGFAGLSVLVAVTIAATIAILARDARGWQLAPFGALAFVLREAASPRAQLFSIVLFAGTLALVLDGDERRLWVCVPVQLLWTQLHGGDPIGVALVGIAFLTRPSRTRAAVASLCAIATCAGPYGLRVHAHFLSARTMLPSIREWEPLSHALAAGRVEQWVAVALVGAAIVAVARRPSVRDALLLALFAAVATRYVRFCVEASIVAAALLSRRLPAFGPRLAVPATLALFAALVPLGTRELGLGLDARRFPIAAVDFLRAHHEPGPMLDSYNFGGYLLYAYDERVFIDGRAFTVYDESTLAELLELYARPDRFPSLEARYGFRLAVLQRSGRGATFARWLAARPGWHTLYADDVALILARR